MSEPELQVYQLCTYCNSTGICPDCMGIGFVTTKAHNTRQKLQSQCPYCLGHKVCGLCGGSSATPVNIQKGRKQRVNSQATNKNGV